MKELVDILMDALPFVVGTFIETIVMSYLHPFDAFAVNLILTVAFIVVGQYPEFVIGLWTQFFMLLLYDSLRLPSKRSYILEGVKGVITVSQTPQTQIQK